MRELIRAATILQGDHKYAVRLYDTGTYDSRGQTRLDYEFDQDSVRLFTGSDFRGSPMHADDSDETLAALLGFLTLRPGDTDCDYFKDYTPDQLAWSESTECEYLQGIVAIAEEEHILGELFVELCPSTERNDR